ncbi:hypothetical protein [Halococcus saccharolyticus]|uniref:hypothetical protein n=1 Tax=Halococcus saccharolyticus TaxID=62319 RepID=UPI00187DBAF5|nr:hypothetical protein [Halococcus saccharolyticus]
MTTLPSIRNARLVARVEIRRSWRKLRANPGRLVLLALAMMFPALLVVAAPFGAYFLGRALRGGGFVLPLRPIRGTATFFILLSVFGNAYRVLQQTGNLDEREGILTTIPARDAATGVLLAEFGRLLVIGIVPVVGVVAGFVLGAHSPLSAVVLPVAALGLLALGVTAGFALGMALKLGFARSQFLASHKTAIGALAFLVYMAVVFFPQFASITGSSFDLYALLGGLPTGWIADLALLGAPGVSVSSLRAGLAASTLLVGVPAFTGLSTRLAARYWYADAIQPDDGNAVKPTTDDTPVSIFEGIVARPTLAAARKTWLRARRAPITLSYVLYPAFVFVVPLQNAVRTGAIPPTLPALVAIYGAWMTGVAFALNPIGDEGATLSVTLTAATPGTQLVRGKILPGVAIGAPATTIATVVAGAFSPLDVVSVAALAVAAVACCVGGSGLAAGIGAAFPRFGSVNITGNREVVVPSLTAFAVFSLGLFVFALPALVVSVPSIAPGIATAIDVSPTAVTTAGVLLTALSIGVVGWLASRYAGRAIDGYTL